MPDSISTASASPLAWAAAGAAATIASGLVAKRLGAFRYKPPRVWKWDAPSGGKFAAINAPTSGARTEKALSVGAHPIQLYSEGTPNGVKVTIVLEEIASQVPTFDYDAWRGAMSKARPVWPASAAQAADEPRLAGAWGSLKHVWRWTHPPESQLAEA